MSGGRRRDTLPAYRSKLLDSVRGQVAAENLFFHLGYWPDPERAACDLSDLVQAQRALNDRVTALAGLRDDLRVLDIGCGVGGNLADIATRHARMRLVGLNLDFAQLEIAREKVSPSDGNALLWVRGDGCSLPFASSSFDRVMAIECMFHFASRSAFFAEAARVLCPGGVLVLSDFVTTDALRSLPDRDRNAADAIEAAIIPSVGPWPELWTGRSGHEGLAARAGLSLLANEDATAHTRPSYRCFLDEPPIRDWRDSTAADAIDRAMAVMEWLQTNGYLEMRFFAFRR